MNRRLIRALAFSGASLLSVLALQAQSGYTKIGCWSPYPNCVGAKDVYKDAAGNYWQCKACGTTTSFSTSYCYQSGNLNAIGYWCPRASS